MSNTGPVQLVSEELLGIIGLFARGYTIRHIRTVLIRRAQERGDPRLVPTDQDLLTLAVRYSDDIEKHRADLARDTLTRGLATKEERVRRLSEAAEAIEGAVLEGLNLKATEQYRKLLDSIREETEPLHINILLPDDPWHQLLLDLREKAAQRGETLPLLPKPLHELVPIPESVSDLNLPKLTQSQEPLPPKASGPRTKAKQKSSISTVDSSKSPEGSEPASPSSPPSS